LCRGRPRTRHAACALLVARGARCVRLCALVECGAMKAAASGEGGA
jgi:hypothetical protein